MTSARFRDAAFCLVVLSALAAGGCGGGPGREPPPQVPGGNPELGLEAIGARGCESCHLIPGVKNATGLVGPPLIHWAGRGFIAGRIPNNGDNLIQWLMDPQAVEPGTDMPNLGIPEDEARNIAAYLFTLR